MLDYERNAVHVTDPFLEIRHNRNGLRVIGQVVKVVPTPKVRAILADNKQSSKTPISSLNLCSRGKKILNGKADPVADVSASFPLPAQVFFDKRQLLLCHPFSLFDHIGEFIAIKEFNPVLEFRDDRDDLGVMRQVMK